MPRSEDINLVVLPRKRKSVTDSMKTVQQKLLSGVDRGLVAFEDRGCEWVAVAGVKGHRNYIFNIRDRLKADRFEFRDGEWCKCKKIAPERAVGLSDAELERCKANKAKAMGVRSDIMESERVSWDEQFVIIDGVMHERGDLESTGMWWDAPGFRVQ